MINKLLPIGYQLVTKYIIVHFFVVFVYSYEDIENLVTKQFSTSSLLDEGIKYLKVRTLIELAPLKQSTSLAKFLQKYKIELTDVNRDTAKQIRRMLYDNTAVSGNALDQVIRSVHQELFTLNNYDNLKTSLKEVAKSSEYIKG